MAEYQIDKEQLKRLIRYDCDAFLAFYLGEELTLEVPELHHELWDEFLALLDEVNQPDRLVGILKKLLGVPREHAKTTLVKLAVILFFRYGRLSFCAYTSNTFGKALNAIKDVKEWLCSEKESELFGAADIEKASEGDGIFILNICIPGQEKKKNVIMMAFGWGTQIRGTLIKNRRPDLLIFDDIESRETAISETQQAKLDGWMAGDALKSMGKLGVCIFIGNMISDTTLLARLSKDSEWRPTVFGAIIKRDGVLCALWEGRWTLEALLKDYASYRKIGLGHVWEAEMMNLTGKEIFGESLANAKRPPRPMADDIEAGFIVLDPAFGLNAWNDYSAITVHVRLHGGDIPILAESVYGKWREEAVFDEMLAVSYRWGITTWVIESVAAQRLLIALFRTYLTQRGMAPEFFLMIPIVAGKESKASRIVSFRSSVANGSYAIAESEQELVELLEKYSPESKDKDDLCDSAAYGSIIWPLHGMVIQGKGRQDVAGYVMGSTGATSVGSLEMNIP